MKLLCQGISHCHQNDRFLWHCVNPKWSKCVDEGSVFLISSYMFSLTLNTYCTRLTVIVILLLCIKVISSDALQMLISRVQGFTFHFVKQKNTYRRRTILHVTYIIVTLYLFWSHRHSIQPIIVSLVICLNVLKHLQMVTKNDKLWRISYAVTTEKNCCNYRYHHYYFIHCALYKPYSSRAEFKASAY